jgi:methylated-DNA-[protein]-cysteine S-methyltransferase
MVEWVETHVAGGPSLRLIASPAGIRAIEFDPEGTPEGQPNSANAVLREAVRQLAAYFQGELREFDLPLDFQGTDFQKRVWRQLETIPYGQTRSYTEIAEAVGSPRAVRAVGAANGANPIPIVIPCHRVIGRSGKLVGYGGGLPLKKRLLELEGIGAAQPGLELVHPV